MVSGACTACALHVHGMCTACALHAHCMCKVCARHVCGMCICAACACARHVQGMCTACAMHVHGMCTACALHVHVHISCPARRLLRAPLHYRYITVTLPLHYRYITAEPLGSIDLLEQHAHATDNRFAMNRRGYAFLSAREDGAARHAALAAAAGGTVFSDGGHGLRYVSRPVRTCASTHARKYVVSSE